MKKLFVAFLLFLTASINLNSSKPISKSFKKAEISTIEAFNVYSLSFNILKNKYNIKTKNIPICLPVDKEGIKRISEYYGIREIHPVLKIKSSHNGIDFSGNIGTPIYPAATGVIKEVKKSFSFGNLIIINHGKGIESYYAHLQHINIVKGQKVTINDTIGTLGNTGWSTGPHLHYEVRIDNIPINPLCLLDLENKKDKLISKMLNQKNLRKHVE